MLSNEMGIRRQHYSGLISLSDALFAAADTMKAMIKELRNAKIRDWTTHKKKRSSDRLRLEDVVVASTLVALLGCETR